MPWNNNSGGPNGGGPWGGGPGGGGDPDRNRRPPQDIDRIFREGQERMKSVFGGGGSGRGGGGDFGLGPYKWPVLGLALLALYAFLSAYTVAPEQRAVITRFGKALEEERLPGLHFRIWPIDVVRPVDFTTIQSITIGQERRPVTGSTRRPRSVAEDDGMMLSSDKNLLDIQFTVFWRVKDSADFLFNLRNPETTVRAVAESAMREVVGRSEAEFVRGSGRNDVRNEVERITQATLDSYETGVEITNVQLNKVDPPSEVNDAFRAVEQAQQLKEQLGNEAERESNRLRAEAAGESQRLVAAAEAYATRTIADAIGEAARYGAIYSEYLEAPELVRRRLFLETMEKVLQGTPTIVLDTDAGAVPYLPLDQVGAARQRAGGQ